MGLSASQARLLSITARLSDNELHSQQIANAKIRLADQSQQASRDYVNALDSQRLVFSLYDANGGRTETPLTPILLYEFADKKNQYGISNASGQLLISTADATNYKNSKDVAEFVSKYGIELIRNREYDDALENIYGNKTSLFNATDPEAYIEDNEYFDTNIVLTDAEGDAYFDQSLKDMLSNIGGVGFSSFQEYNDFKNTLQGRLSSTSAFGNVGANDTGYFAAYVNTLRNMPEFTELPPDEDEMVGPKPVRPDDLGDPVYEVEPYPDPFPYAVSLIQPACWGGTGIYNTSNPSDPKTLYNDPNMQLSYNQIWHMEHVLAQYIWNGKAVGTAGSMGSDYTDLASGDSFTIKGETVTNTYNPSNQWGITGGGAATNQTVAQVDPKNVQGVLANDAAAGENSLKLRERLRELYVQVLYSIQEGVRLGYSVSGLTSSDNLQDGTVTDNGGITHATRSQISFTYYNLMKDILTATAQDIIADKKNGDLSRWATCLNEYETKCNQVDMINTQRELEATALQGSEYTSLLNAWLHKKEEYLDALEKYNAKIEVFLSKDVNTWLSQVNSALTSYRRSLSYVPEEHILNESDPKTQWYINMWHRLNGGSDQNVNAIADENGNVILTKTDAKASQNWKILEDSLLKSSSWLQFALEQGLVTLEQVQKTDDVETDTGLKTTKWQSRIYTTCTDIQFVDDESAIAKAEAEYTRKISEIEAKDKRYDNDMKKLDTEHNALQTEYESVKTVIDKNIERSFKAFS